MNIIKQKQVEMFGNEPKTKQEQILTISDPVKRKLLLMQDSKCQELKNEMEYVTSDSQQFDEYFNKFRKMQQIKEEKIRSRQHQNEDQQAIQKSISPKLNTTAAFKRNKDLQSHLNSRISRDGLNERSDEFRVSKSKFNHPYKNSSLPVSISQSP